MDLDFSIVWGYAPTLLQGLALTLGVTAACALAGSLLGFALSLARSSGVAALSAPVTLYVEFFRGTPLLIQLFWVYFCFPIVLGLKMPAVVAVMVSLTLYMGAITCETFRGSLKSIGAEQHDACVALGLPVWTRVVWVIFPQALLRAIPPLLSNVVSLFKESALISSVGVADLMFVGQNLSNSTARPIEFLSAVGLIYFLVAFPVTRLVGSVEARLLRRFA
ncbi:amino acid ABC transporter permease [Pseudaquabacterium rugosum]|jgi:polar amino acid transport system permease protein|uniref:Amino acid ABC transporter permease n=1 Tax=Pseudaquabacterium rugosum TaxID=2984194 RepID=A0ABU9BCV9_9BURK